MFPEYRDLISQLKTENAHFAVLFHDHNELDHRIRREEERPAADHEHIVALKKEKLRLKDEMYQILKSYVPAK